MDDTQRSELEEQERELQTQASKIMEEIESLDSSYQQNKADLNEKTKVLLGSREMYHDTVSK